jgi:hypothetical protein
MVLDEPVVPASKSKRHLREVSALRAWHAVLASFLLFASPVAKAETVQIIDDRGGLVIAYQMQWRCWPHKAYMYKSRALCFRVHHTAWLYTARKNLCKLQGVSRVPIWPPLILSLKIC